MEISGRPRSRPAVRRRSTGSPGSPSRDRGPTSDRCPPRRCEGSPPDQTATSGSPPPPGITWVASRRAGRSIPFGLTAGSAPAGIAPGTDGNVWFAEQAGRIGQVTPAGEVTEFDSRAARTPYGITAGADGNIWFVDRSANAIGRVATAADEHRIRPFVRRRLRAQSAGRQPRRHHPVDLFRPESSTASRTSPASASSTQVRFVRLLLFDDADGSRDVQVHGPTPSSPPWTRTARFRCPSLANPAKGTSTTGFAITWATAAPAPGLRVRRPDSAARAAGYVCLAERHDRYVGELRPRRGPGHVQVPRAVCGSRPAAKRPTTRRPGPSR